MKNIEPLKTTVLVVEDEALIRLDLVEMLLEESYDVIGQAENGAIAVELAEKLKPDVVLMDIKMPVRDGIDASKEITDKKLSAVVILTAFSQKESIEKAIDAGAMAYLVKPITKADLIPCIELAISRFKEINILEQELVILEDKLETRKFLDRAKGIIMEKKHLSEADAFKLIQRVAMNQRVTMKDVALEILNDADKNE